MPESPFERIESAHEYVRLLVSQVEEVRSDIQTDIADAEREQAARRLDALQVVDYKLKQLQQYLGASSRILNDLRMLRRLLLADGETPAGD
jgi:hypothetical protein